MHATPAGFRRGGAVVLWGVAGRRPDMIEYCRAKTSNRNHARGANYVRKFRKESPSTGFQDNELWHLPREQGRELIFGALDALEEPVLIIDKDTRIVYANSSYVRTYASALGAAGIPVEDITGYRLTDMHDQTDVLPVLDALKKQRPRLKYYSLVGDTLTAFTDIIPLSMEDELLGAVVISRDTAQIAQMSHEMNRYKAMADELRRELDARPNCPSPSGR